MNRFALFATLAVLLTPCAALAAYSPTCGINGGVNVSNACGILPVANGGTGSGSALTQGSVVFAGSGGALTEDNLALFWNDTSNMLGIGTNNPLAKLTMSGSISAPAWTTAGIGIRQVAATYTDTTSSGAIGSVRLNTFAAPAFAASSVVTYSSASTFYIAGAPTEGTNVTITSPLSLFVDAGDTRFDGWLSVGAGTSPSSVLFVAGNHSAAAWGTAGIQISTGVATLTDTTGTGTVANAHANSLRTPTFAASNVGVTYTTASTLYIQNAPTAGTNVTITQPYAFYVSAGNVRINDFTSFGSLTPTSVVTIGGSQSAASWTTTGLDFSVASSTLTDTTGSGTVTVRAANSFGTPTLASSSAVTVTNASTVYINAAPAAGTNTTLTNSWALYVAAGNVDFLGQLFIPNIATDAGKTDATACVDTTTGQFYKGTGALGICLGTSSARYKTKIADTKDGLSKIMGLRPVTFRYKQGYVDDGVKEQYGFIAEDVVKVLPKLTSLDKDGRPNSVDYVAMIPVLVKAVQELKADNDNLRQLLAKGGKQ